MKKNNSKAQDLEKLAFNMENELKKSVKKDEERMSTLLKLEIPISCASSKKKQSEGNLKSIGDDSIFELSCTDEKMKQQFLGTINYENFENISQIDFSNQIAETTKNSEKSVSRISPTRKLIFTSPTMESFGAMTNSINTNLFNKEKKNIGIGEKKNIGIGEKKNILKNKYLYDKENIWSDRNEVVKKSKSSAWLDIF